MLPSKMNLVQPDLFQQKSLLGVGNLVHGGQTWHRSVLEQSLSHRKLVEKALVYIGLALPCAA
jgi:hypothetical protein